MWTCPRCSTLNTEPETRCRNYSCRVLRPPDSPDWSAKLDRVIELLEGVNGHLARLVKESEPVHTKLVPCPMCEELGESDVGETDLVCSRCGHEWTIDGGTPFKVSKPEY